MSITNSTHRDSIVIGSGKLFFDRFDGDGNLTGEEYLGDSVEATVTTSSEYIEVFSGDGAQARQLVNQPRQVTRSGSVVLHDMSLENWALWAGGEAPSVLEQAAVAVVDEEITVRQGRYYTLGQGDALLKLGDSSVAVKSNSDTAIDQDGNWLIDRPAGRIYIVPGGAITDGDTIKISYTPEARQVQVATAGPPIVVRGALRYVEDDPINTLGRDLYIPNATLAPSGDTALKSRDSEQQLTLNFTMQPRAIDGISIIISGEAA